jgi:hypothetical protein
LILERFGAKIVVLGRKKEKKAGVTLDFWGNGMILKKINICKASFI